MGETSALRYSVIVPLYNEEDNVGPLTSALVKVMDHLGEPYELIYVDDGSRDTTLDRTRELAKRYPPLRVVALARNYGQTAALVAGFDHSRGEIIVTLDGDLQNDPKDIPRLLERLEEGYDMVTGWRQNRQEPFLTRRLPSQVANWLISRVMGVALHDYGCTLKVCRARVVRKVSLYGEMHRFIPALAAFEGARISEVPVADHPRRHGRSKYGLGRVANVLLDLLTVKFLQVFGTKPIRIFGFPGGLAFIVGVLLGMYLTVLKFSGHAIGHRPLLILAVLLILFGAQLIMMGLIGELLVRIYHESQGKPIYSVKESMEKKA